MESVGGVDPNDKARPYGKMINAIFVIGYALTDNQQLQWHSTEDYESLACKLDNRFHDDLYYRIITGPGSNATTVIPAVGTNHTDIHCPVFREGNPANSASHRAGVMVHEGWHHWQYHTGFTLNHPSGGSAAGWPGGGDWFYPHTVSRFAFGSPARLLDQSQQLPLSLALPSAGRVSRRRGRVVPPSDSDSDHANGPSPRERDPRGGLRQRRVIPDRQSSPLVAHRPRRAYVLVARTSWGTTAGTATLRHLERRPPDPPARGQRQGAVRP